MPSRINQEAAPSVCPSCTASDKGRASPSGSRRMAVQNTKPQQSKAAPNKKGGRSSGHRPSGFNSLA
jgi:hypothetical protein